MQPLLRLRRGSGNGGGGRLVVLVTAAAMGTLERWGVVVLWYCVPHGTDEEKRGAELGRGGVLRGVRGVTVTKTTFLPFENTKTGLSLKFQF